MLQRQTHWRCQEVFLWCVRCCASACARCGARGRLSRRCTTQREHTRNTESNRTTQENEVICMSLCLEHRTKQNNSGSKRLSFVSLEFCTLMCCLCRMSPGSGSYSLVRTRPCSSTCLWARCHPPPKVLSCQNAPRRSAVSSSAATSPAAVCYSAAKRPAAFTSSAQKKMAAALLTVLRIHQGRVPRRRHSQEPKYKEIDDSSKDPTRQGP